MIKTINKPRNSYSLLVEAYAKILEVDMVIHKAKSETTWVIFFIGDNWRKAYEDALAFGNLLREKRMRFVSLSQTFVSVSKEETKSAYMLAYNETMDKEVLLSHD